MIGDGGPDVWGADAYPWTEPEGDDSSAHLVFDISPDDAVVYVDDEFAGMAFELGELEGGLEVEPGDHVVMIVRPGYAEVTVKIEVPPGEHGKVEVDLEEARKPAPAQKDVPVVKPATSA